MHTRTAHLLANDLPGVRRIGGQQLVLQISLLRGAEDGPGRVLQGCPHFMLHSMPSAESICGWHPQTQEPKVMLILILTSSSIGLLHSIVGTCIGAGRQAGGHVEELRNCHRVRFTHIGGGRVLQGAADDAGVQHDELDQLADVEAAVDLWRSTNSTD
jgi:hypothetical protein